MVYSLLKLVPKIKKRCQQESKTSLEWPTSQTQLVGRNYKGNEVVVHIRTGVVRRGLRLNELEIKV